MNDIEISNIALIHCGIVDTISSFEDASEEAGVISTVFDTVKLSMLAEYPWNFAVEWSNLSPLVEVPGNPDFEYQFQLNSTYLRVIAVVDEYGHPLDWAYEANNRICANVNNIKVKYLKNVTTTDLPAYFANALAAKLATQIVIALTEDVGKLNLLMGMYQRLDAKAKLLDMKSNPPPTVISTSNSRLIQSRYTH